MGDDDRFDWDDGNLWKIQERFEIESVEAIFDDEDRIPRPAYSVGGERRWGLIGATWDDRVLFVVYTWRGPKIRIISARRAEPREQSAYWAKRSRRR
jgi:uncharacterized DUF497 family protein